MSCTSANTEPTPVQDQDIESLEIAQANLYFALSRALSSPLEMDDGHSNLLRTLPSDLDTTLEDPINELADAWMLALKDREKLSLAYARLFLGPFEIQASPYESFYLDANQQLMGDVSMSVARAYAEAGLGPGKGPREAPDHIALEMEFVYYLTHQFVTTGDQKWRGIRQHFLTSHLNRWTPSLSDAIRKADEHPFYNALASLLAVL
jgi:putative dimethyl sulfoxide reductase chaperone